MKMKEIKPCKYLTKVERKKTTLKPIYLTAR
jgi:hypothetical protein